ncbi:MAG: hypothetical protein ACJ79J_08975, partial [Gemmatimonadaceae bacterium]
MTGSELHSYATPGLRRSLSAAVLAWTLSITMAGCVHNAVVRPSRQAYYWEALAELHPVDAAAAAHTPSEAEFAQALGDLMSGDIEKAE